MKLGAGSIWLTTTSQALWKLSKYLLNKYINKNVKYKSFFLEDLHSFFFHMQKDTSNYSFLHQNKLVIITVGQYILLNV